MGTKGRVVWKPHILIESVEFCPICKKVTTMVRNPMQIPIFAEEEHDGAPPPRGGWKTKRIGTVTAWVICTECNTAVRSEEVRDAN